MVSVFQGRSEVVSEGKTEVVSVGKTGGWSLFSKEAGRCLTRNPSGKWRGGGSSLSLLKEKGGYLSLPGKVGDGLNSFREVRV